MVKPSDIEPQLIDAMIHGKSDAVLYITCLYVYHQWHAELEEIFIKLVAQIGEHFELPFVATWMHVCQELLHLIHSDENHISDLFAMSTMISMMHTRLHLQTYEKKQSHHKLKKEILEYFPEKARLSYRGVEVFGQVIPKSPDDLNAFVHRILAGFMRLFEQKNAHEIYQSLVYISKKRLSVPLPSSWPAPDEQTAKQGDPIWLLWGMLLLYFRSENVATNWKLFCHNFKKKHKNQRLGLLYGASFRLDVATSSAPIWTLQEEQALAKVKQLAPTLWADFLQHMKSEETEQEGTDDDIDPITYFEPRGTLRERGLRDPPVDTYMISTVHPVKSIEVNQRSQGKGDLRPKLTKIKKVE